MLRVEVNPKAILASLVATILRVADRPLGQSQSFVRRRLQESPNVRYLFHIRVHRHIFPENTALYIIWCEEPGETRRSIAAGSFDAMNAALGTVQAEYHRAELMLQMGARSLRRRGPLLD